MKPIFTIHAGEYLVGAEIERICTDYEIWLPSRDVGVDLLLRHKKTGATKTVQVKFSKSWTETHANEQFRKHFRTQGWWSLNRSKLENSPADFWVFALYSFDTSKNDFLIFRKQELIELYKRLDHWDTKTIQSYFWTLKNGTAFEGRGVRKRELKELIEHPENFGDRNVSSHLNNWKLITG